MLQGNRKTLVLCEVCWYKAHVHHEKSHHWNREVRIQERSGLTFPCIFWQWPNQSSSPADQRLQLGSSCQFWKNVKFDEMRRWFTKVSVFGFQLFGRWWVFPLHLLLPRLFLFHVVLHIVKPTFVQVFKVALFKIFHWIKEVCLLEITEGMDRFFHQFWTVHFVCLHHHRCVLFQEDMEGFWGGLKVVVKKTRRKRNGLFQTDPCLALQHPKIQPIKEKSRELFHLKEKTIIH